MRISLRAVIAFLIFLTVFIVAICALMITYTFSISAMRKVGHDQSISIHTRASDTFNGFVNEPLRHLQLIQSRIRMGPSSAAVGAMSRYRFPNESHHDPNWYEPWHAAMQDVAILSNFSYSQVLLLFEDDALCRYLNVDENRRGNFYCSRVDPSSPKNTSLLEEHTTQFFSSNLSTPAELYQSPYKKLLATWIPSSKAARALVGNDVGGYYFSEFFVGSFPTDFILPLFGAMHNSTGHYLGALGIINGIRPLTAFLKQIDRTPNSHIFVVDNWGAVAGTTYEDAPWYSMTFPDKLNYTAPLEGPWCRRSIPGAPNVEACRFHAKNLPFAPIQVALNDEEFIQTYPKTETEPETIRVNVENGETTSKEGFLVNFRELDVDGEKYYATAAPNPTIEGFTVEAQDGDHSQIRFYIIFLMPEKDIIGDIEKGRDLAIISTVIICVIMIVIAVVATHLLIATLSDLAAQMQDSARLGEPSRRATSRLSEVNELCVAYNTMNQRLAVVKSFVPQNIMELDAGSDDHSSTSISSFSESNSVRGVSQFTTVNPLNNTGTSALSNSNTLSVGNISNFAETTNQGLLINEERVSTVSNQFHIRRCTAVAIDWPSLPTGDPALLGVTVAKHLQRVVKKAIDAGGVIESLDPGYILVTFNSHFTCLMHEERATSFAMKISKKLHRDAFVVIDTTDCCVGTVGAHGRRSRAVLGECIDTVRKLTALLRTYVTSKLLITERCARGVSNRTFSLVDVVTPSWYQTDRARAIHLAVPSGIDLQTNTNGQIFTTTHKSAFSALMRGNLAEAVSIWKTIDAWDTDAHIVRLVTSCESLLAIGAGVYRRGENIQWDAVANPIWYQFIEPVHQRRVQAAEDVADQIDTVVAKQGGSHTVDGNVSDDDASTQPFGFIGFAPTSSAPTSTNQNVAPLMRVGFDQVASNSGIGTHNPHTVVDIQKTVTDVQGVEWTRAENCLASGAFADVYQGLSSTGVVSAIKVVRTNSRNFDINGLKAEVQLLCQLQHQNVVSYVSIAVDGTRAVFIIMEYISGGSLKDILTRFGRLRKTMVRRFTVDMVKGLAYLHQHNVVHCDIKPHNILLSVDGIVKLADFGSSVNQFNVEGDDTASYENMRGTTWYVAPEVAHGAEPTAASDVWSLAITVLELLNGELPWTAAERCHNNEVMFLRQLGGKDSTLVPTIPAKTGIPDDLISMLRKCLQRDPALRPSCEDLLNSDFAL